MKIQAIILLLATLATGIMSGIFFTWSNAVTTGLARLTDLEYLRAFQAMNRSILNPAFFVAIFSPVMLLPFLAYQYYKVQPITIFWVLIAACLLYIIGVILVTFAGNVPLNTTLDKSVLETASLEGAKSLRDSFENRWNFLNWIRTYSAVGAFILLIVICIISNNR